MSDASQNPEPHHKGPSGGKIVFELIFGVVLPAVIVAGGWFGYQRLMETAPKAERKGKHGGEQARLVETAPLEIAQRPVTVEAMGLTVPSRSVSLQAQVGGEIVWAAPSLAPGGLFKAGDAVVKIDASDYELAVRQCEAEAAQAESDLNIEMGQQEIARQEFELLGRDIPGDDQSLVLRKPQLAKARADLDAARTALESANLDLARTQIAAPFDCIVLEENVETGAIAGTSSALAELAGADVFWIELAVPVDDLKWIDLPGLEGQSGACVKIYDEAAWGAGVSREGRVVRFSGELDADSRSATLIAAVEDPLALKPENAGAPRLLLNSYVNAEIEGHEAPGAIVIERDYIHDGDTVWIMNGENRLEIRPVGIVRRNKDVVFATAGVAAGENIVVSNFSSPVEGMLLRTRDQKQDSARETDAHE